jgi:hypothetical protein
MPVVLKDEMLRLVMFPDGKIHEINILRMLVQTQNAEFKAKHGMFLPGIAKQHPTVKALREEYALNCKTWKEAAHQMREFYNYLMRD